MIRQLINYVIATLWIALLFPLAVLLMLVTMNAGNSMWMARAWWAPFQLWVGRVHVIVKGREHVDPKRPTVYVINHQSTIDILATLLALPVNFRFVAKSQLKWVPILGWYLWMAGHILVDRQNSKNAIRSLDKAAKQIRDGKSIVLFPEGTRSPDGRILPFKKGPFLLALKAGVAVVPVTIEGSGKVMPKNSWDVKPGNIYVAIGEPIDSSKYSLDQREEFIRRVRNVIIEQSLQLGGVGGDRDDAIARSGTDGSSRKAS